MWFFCIYCKKSIMKKNYFAGILLCLCVAVQAQTITFADNNFKNALLEASPENLIALNYLGNPVTIDTNQDGEIQVDETNDIVRLLLSGRLLTNLSGIEFFTDLTDLNCSFNNITSLDVRDLSGLYSLDCSFNNLTDLRLEALLNLQILNCSYNQLSTAFDFTGMSNLHIFKCSDNHLTNLDITPLTALNVFDCSNNSINTIDFSYNNSNVSAYCNHNALHTIFMKNGFDDSVHFEYNPTLQFVCADAEEIPSLLDKIIEYGYTNVTVGSECMLDVASFTAKPDFTVYPNPVTDVMHIQSETDVPIIALSVYNMLGQLVADFPDTKSHIANISHLHTGNYILKVVSAEGISSIRFIKN